MKIIYSVITVDINCVLCHNGHCGLVYRMPECKSDVLQQEMNFRVLIKGSVKYFHLS